MGKFYRRGPSVRYPKRVSGHKWGSNYGYRRRRRPPLLTIAIVLGAAYLAAQAFVARWDGAYIPSGITQSIVSEVRRFAPCTGYVDQNCVVDGDTIRINGERIRLADIDAPETYRARCDSERALGTQATDRLVGLMNSGEIAVEASGDRDRDRYGRSLRVVTHNGRSVGDTLVSEGLARRWDGARHPWCN